MRPFKAWKQQWIGLYVGGKPTPAVVRFTVAKVSEAAFWKHLQNSHWLVAKPLVAKDSISTPKVSSFFWHHFIHFANIGRCFTNNEQLKPNLLCPEVTLQSKHTHTEASAQVIQAVVSVFRFLSVLIPKWFYFTISVPLYLWTHKYARIVGSLTEVAFYPANNI